MKREHIGALLSLAALTAFLLVVAGIESFPDDVRLDLGDVATWFEGIATAIVAGIAGYIAWRAHRTAQTALANDLRDEASRIIWWFELEDALDNKVRSSVRAFPSQDYEPDSGMPADVDFTTRAVLRIVNGSGAVVSDAAFAMDTNPDLVHEYSQGVQQIGLLRPGTTLLRIFLMKAGDTSKAIASDRHRIENHLSARWLHFTDSNGYHWRRHSNGRLEPLDVGVRALLDKNLRPPTDA